MFGNSDRWTSYLKIAGKVSLIQCRTTNFIPIAKNSIQRRNFQKLIASPHLFRSSTWVLSVNRNRKAGFWHTRLSHKTLHFAFDTNHLLIDTTQTMKVFSAALTLISLASPAECFDGSIRADSQMGQNLMSKARKLNNNNNYNNYNY